MENSQLVFFESISGTKFGLDIVSATTFSFPGIWQICEVYSVIKISWHDCLEDQGGDTQHIVIMVCDPSKCEISALPTCNGHGGWRGM